MIYRVLNIPGNTSLGQKIKMHKCVKMIYLSKIGKSLKIGIFLNHFIVFFREINLLTYYVKFIVEF